MFVSFIDWWLIDVPADSSSFRLAFVFACPVRLSALPEPVPGLPPFESIQVGMARTFRDWPVAPLAQWLERWSYEP